MRRVRAAALTALKWHCDSGRPGGGTMLFRLPAKPPRQVPAEHSGMAGLAACQRFHHVPRQEGKQAEGGRRRMSLHFHHRARGCGGRRAALDCSPGDEIRCWQIPSGEDSGGTDLCCFRHNKFYAALTWKRQVVTLFFHVHKARPNMNFCLTENSMDTRCWVVVFIS